MNFFKFLRRYTIFIIIVSILCGGAAVAIRKQTYRPMFKATIPINAKLKNAKKVDLLDVNQYLSSNIQSYESLIASYPFTYEIAKEMKQSNKKISESISTSGDSGTSLFTINVTTKNNSKTKRLSKLVLKQLDVMSNQINSKIKLVNLNSKLYIQKIYQPSFAYYGILGGGLGFIMATIIALLIDLVKMNTTKNKHGSNRFHWYGMFWNTGQKYNREK